MERGELKESWDVNFFLQELGENIHNLSPKELLNQFYVYLISMKRMAGYKMKTVVIAFGNAGHGKDTFVDFCIKEHQYTQKGAWIAIPCKVSFADTLKEVTAILLGVPIEYCYDREKKENYTVYGKTVREWLQWLGTDICRNQMHKDIWIHRFCDKVQNQQNGTIFCADGRFINEMKVTKEKLKDTARVITVKVERPSEPVNLKHPSESEIYHADKSLFDVVIRNEGDLGSLEVLAKKFVKNHVSVVTYK